MPVKLVGVQYRRGFIEIQRTHTGVEDRTHFRVGLNVVENRCAENFVETRLAGLNGVMQAVPAREQVMKHLCARAVGAWGVGA